MSKPEPLLEKGKFYHIYNRGINSCNLFTGAITYEQFLCLYQRYITPVAETYAWVLMPNHFHLLVRIKANVVYKYSGSLPSLNADRSDNTVRFNKGNFEKLKWETTDMAACKAPDCVNVGKVPNPAHHFSHLFNAYSKFFNNLTGRHGSLFERPFDRKEITDFHYFKRLVIYIHNNPVHHKFVEHAFDYPWSSYLTCVSIKPTLLQRDDVLGWFDSQANFKTAHEGDNEYLNINEWFRFQD